MDSSLVSTVDVVAPVLRQCQQPEISLEVLHAPSSRLEQTMFYYIQRNLGGTREGRAGRI